MLELLSRPWPWYVAGPLIGLMVPALLLAGNRLFGISATFRHVCAAVAPVRSDYLTYDWKSAGGWNLVFALGALVGGGVVALLIGHPDTITIADATRADLTSLGITRFDGFVPREMFSLESLFSVRGFIVMVGGGFLVGFGTAYAGGCTSGHGVAGLANFELASFLAVIGFFAGGLVGTHLLMPLIL